MHLIYSDGVGMGISSTTPNTILYTLDHPEYTLQEFVIIIYLFIYYSFKVSYTIGHYTLRTLVAVN